MTDPLPGPLLAAPGAGVPDAPAARLEDWFDAVALRRNRRYRAGVWALGAVGMVTGPALTLTVALSGPRWRAPIVRISGGRPIAAAVAFAAALALADNPVIGFIDGYGAVVVALRVALNRHAVNEHRVNDFKYRRFIAAADIG